MQETPPRSPAAPSLALRAILAVALMVGFYLLAIGIAAALLGGAYAIVALGHNVPVKLVVFMVVGGFAVLWGILPRFDRFTPPGPELLPAEHPRLFERITRIARATGQEMPHSVYLVPNVNAWVSRRGGIMGFGSRPILGVGLPLLAALDVAEMEAVLAHEFGHFHGGDTKLGPWVHTTRAAIGRTLASLQQAGGRSLHAVFVAYGNLFLRLTLSVSRRQEYAADALAARIVGARPLATGLERIGSAAMAYDAYLDRELGPVVAAGFRAPVAEGFMRFVRAGPVATSLEQAIAARKRDEKESPYDSHPPLRDRLAALGPLVANASDDGGGPAIALLDSVSQMEERLLAWMLRGKEASKLRPLAWNAAAEAVWLPAWREARIRNSLALQGRTPETLPTTRAELVAIGHKVVRKIAVKNEATFVRDAIGLLGGALVVVLLETGWSLDAEPGAEVSVSNDGERLEPFRVVGDLAEGRLAPSEWLAICRRSGIGSLGLSAPEPPRT